MFEGSDISIGACRWPLDCSWSIQVASSIIAASQSHGSRAAARLCRQVGGCTGSRRSDRKICKVTKGKRFRAVTKMKRGIFWRMSKGFIQSSCAEQTVP